MKFSGKTFLLLGVSKGLGYAMAYFLAREGATVIVSSRSAEKLREMEATLRKYGNVIAIPGEVKSRESVEELKSRVMKVTRTLNGLAVMIGGYEEDTVEDLKGLDTMINNHLRYPLLAVSVFLEMMSKGSTILLVSALRGIDRPASTQLSYASAKAGLAKAVEVLALELLDRGIRVVGIAPSWIDGEFQPERDWKSLRNLGDEKAPPEDFALVATWLMSEDAEWVNGVVIPVDGGTRLKWG